MYWCVVLLLLEVVRAFESDSNFHLQKLDSYPLALCLDGSPAAYYWRRASSPESANKWKIHFMGGGWCYNDATCAERADGFLGSAAKLNATIDLNMIGVGIAPDSVKWQTSDGVWHSNGTADGGLLSNDAAVSGA